jgi:hypothetical protein
MTPDNAKLFGQIEVKTNELIARLKDRQLAAQGFKAVYLPNFVPAQKAKYIFIAMEPSLRWANCDEDTAKEMIRNGFLNFMYSGEDFCLHYSIANFLGTPYYVTDTFKAAMECKDAADIREYVYPECIPLLKEEINAVGSPDCLVFFLGNAPP